MTMVAGRIAVENGQLLSGDLAQSIVQANRAVPLLFERRSEWLRQNGTIDALRI
ncbi:hypothetical protein [Variovorax guangxiensis]|uniref:hypothetical protein n=1 Tax=Variovorax guangxiensis TaxID=1775474 RepID=UPI002860FF1E|nr:hypothetical protein [Variovorax guangxiensis]MDR6861152.1 hypothetical protein [Variovorax guangxiensis]